MDQAACKGVDPEVFFPTRGEGWKILEAKRYCRSCTVRSECLDYGIETSAPGIYGGTSALERRRMYGVRAKHPDINKDPLANYIRALKKSQQIYKSRLEFQLKEHDGGN